MGDYWTVSSGIANHTGSTCRECRKTINMNTPIYVRDGRKIRLFYHETCFSGDSDPRTQAQSSASKWKGGVGLRAPSSKGYGKWWTSSYGYQGSLQSRSLSSNLPVRRRRASSPSINITSEDQRAAKTPVTTDAHKGGPVVEMHKSLESSSNNQEPSSMSRPNLTGTSDSDKGKMEIVQRNLRS